MHPEKLTKIVENEILTSKIYQDLAAEKERIEYIYETQKQEYKDLLQKYVAANG
jgi:hypothetical protein